MADDHALRDEIMAALNDPANRIPFDSRKALPRPRSGGYIPSPPSRIAFDDAIRRIDALERRISALENTAAPDSRTPAAGPADTEGCGDIAWSALGTSVCRLPKDHDGDHSNGVNHWRDDPSIPTLTEALANEAAGRDGRAGEAGE